MKISSYCIITVFMIAAFSMAVWAGDLVVIVNKDNNYAVDKALVVKIYTGATKNWPDGSPILAIDQSEENPVREEFNASILGKTIANMKALWAQNIFTGKALPPKIANPDLEVKKIVSANKNAIGYIKASSVDDTVRVAVK